MEVVLALGIVAVAILPAVALLPVGLDVHRSAINLTVGAQILQRVTADLEQASFASLLPPATLPLRYFDEQGGELLTASSPAQPDANSPQRVYDVKVLVTSPGVLLGQPSYNLVGVQILVAHNPGHSPQAFAAGSKVYSTYFALVAHRS